MTIARWQAFGAEIAQPPMQMDFGFTAVALDPDGHRLRVFVPAERQARERESSSRRRPCDAPSRGPTTLGRERVKSAR